MFKSITAFFKREDAYAREGVKRIEGLANGIHEHAKRELEAIKGEFIKAESALRAEIVGLKKQVTSLKREIAKFAPKKARGK